MARLKDKVTIAEDELYLTHGMVLCLVSMSMSTVDFYSASPHPPLMRLTDL